MKIGQKLILGFAGIALLAGIVGAIAIKYTAEIRKDVDVIAMSNLDKVEGATEIAYYNQRIKTGIRELLLETIHKDPEEIKRAKGVIKESISEIQKFSLVWKNAINAGIKLGAEEEELRAFENVETKVDNFIILVNKLLLLYEEKGYEEAEEFFDAEVEPLSREIQSVVKDLEEDTEEETISRVEEVRTAIRKTVRISIGLTVIAFFAAIGLGSFISGSISNPVTKLRDVTTIIAKGDLSQRVDIKSKDEIGELAASFNQMADEVQKRNEELQTMNEELRSTNEELETSNEELQSTTEELEASNEELRTTQEELVQKEKLAAVGQLASGVGHELRNPLGVIKNAVYYIKSKIGEADPKLAKHIGIIEREIANSNRIISDLLGFSRIRPPAVGLLDINKIVEAALEVVEVPENIGLVKKLGSNLPGVMADSGQIQQVFVNLSLNAIQAIVGEGSLTIATRKKDDFIEVEFTDTGCGISEKDIKKLFDPFFTTKARGIGLGLAVTQGIIERHYGSIEVISNAGEGAAFIVKLPVKKEE